MKNGDAVAVVFIHFYSHLLLGFLFVDASFLFIAKSLSESMKEQRMQTKIVRFVHLMTDNEHHHETATSVHRLPCTQFRARTLTIILQRIIPYG